MGKDRIKIHSTLFNHRRKTDYFGRVPTIIRSLSLPLFFQLQPYIMPPPLYFNYSRQAFPYIIKAGYFFFGFFHTSSFVLLELNSVNVFLCASPLLKYLS